MKEAWAWVRKHWYILAAVVVAVVAFALGSRRGVNGRLADELDANDVGARGRRDAADRGADAANEVADAKYAETIAKLDSKQARKAEKYRRNPARRVRFLNRLTSAQREPGDRVDKGGGIRPF